MGLALAFLLAIVVMVTPFVSLAMVYIMRGRLRRAGLDIERLSARLDSLEGRLVAAPASDPIVQPAVAEHGRRPEPARRGEAPVAATVERPEIGAARPAVLLPPVSPGAPADVPRPEPPADPRRTFVAPELVPAAGFGSGVLNGFKAWLLGGNTVVRVGVVVLFFGVAFFLNYAIDRGWLPVEVRLMLAALGGLAVAATGWRLRGARRDYALVLQGGGVGIVYLTVFAGVNPYGVLPAGAGLALMIALVALSSALAVLQDARSLALLAALGGFLAPILVSREGSHVALFSYYGVLDAGILAIAWFKRWRALNRLGFAFTFIISTAWGVLSYRPDLFASTEPFLVAFFLFYVAVPVLFAWRPGATGAHEIDRLLLFGVPLVASGLQAALVRDFEYGSAFSALGAGTFYVTLASALRRRLKEAAGALAEIFLALGIAFSTLAIPLAVDGRWTGSAWALEGAALVWVGFRQRRQLARAAGFFLQFGAGLMFLSATDGPVRDVAVLNSVYLGAVVVSLAGLFSAWCFDRHRAELHRTEAGTSVVMLGWGLLWWFGAGGNEIATFVSSVDKLAILLVFAAASSAVLTGLCRGLRWRQLRFPVLLLLPVMAVVAEASFARDAHPLARWGGVAWGAALLTHYWIQWRVESEWPVGIAPYWHAGMLWLVLFLASWEASWLVGRVASDVATWKVVGWVVVPVAAIPGVPILARSLKWPLQRFGNAYERALIPVVGLAAFWVLLASLERGSPAPLPYVPALNPLELAQGLALAVILRWTPLGWRGLSAGARWSAWSVLVFVALNGVIARATHVYGGVEFGFEELWSSPRYQTAVSIAWTGAALATMLCARWLKQRAVWFPGAALLAAVVVKLFLVDLEDVGTVARIVSFVAVGLLMLLVGYLSPLPPRSQEQSP